MKLLDFSPRPGGTSATSPTYRPGTDLATFGFAEQFLIWATRASQAGLDAGPSRLRLEAAFAAIDAPDAFPLLQQFLGLLKIEFGRALTAPCLKWRSLMADEARVLTLLAQFQRTIAGVGKPASTLPAPLLQTGQRLALTLSATGLILRPNENGVETHNWAEAMPTLH
jgi:hypothetical protein